MRVRLVRHGESEGNVAATLQGCRLDTPLSARGRRQAEALAIFLAGAEMDGVVTSPMQRARETAEVIAAPHGLGIAVDVELVEFDWGVWTGRSFDEGMERDVAGLRARWRAGDTSVLAPGGESPQRAAERASRVLARLKASGFLAPVVVAHGRFNRILMTLLLGRDLARMDDIRQRNGALSVFEWDGEGPATPLALDEVGHLGVDLRASTAGSDSLR